MGPTSSHLHHPSLRLASCLTLNSVGTTTHLHRRYCRHLHSHPHPLPPPRHSLRLSVGVESHSTFFFPTPSLSPNPHLHHRPLSAATSPPPTLNVCPRHSLPFPLEILHRSVAGALTARPHRLLRQVSRCQGQPTKVITHGSSPTSNLETLTRTLRRQTLRLPTSVTAPPTNRRRWGRSPEKKVHNRGVTSHIVSVTLLCGLLLYQMSPRM
jgi:hypothetical protein